MGEADSPGAPDAFPVGADADCVASATLLWPQPTTSKVANAAMLARRAAAGDATRIPGDFTTPATWRSRAMNDRTLPTPPTAMSSLRRS